MVISGIYKRGLILTMKKRKMSAFDYFNYCFLIILCITTLLPFIYIVIVSLLNDTMNITLDSLKLSNISFLSYKRVFDSKFILFGARNSIIRTALGTSLNLIFTILAAYPLSKRDYRQEILLQCLWCSYDVLQWRNDTFIPAGKES